jgi:diguanylate cyclase (GGDEF)-like protein
VNTETNRQIIQHPDQQTHLGRKLRQMLQRVNPRDILTTSVHSSDFKNSRAEYISIRIRTLALVFALLAPLWIPIDYALMEGPVFMKFLALRVGFTVAFLALALWGTRCNRLTMARLRITLFITIPGLFYLASYSIMSNGHNDATLLLGYSFLPLLIMALMTIVPLTLLEGAGFMALIVAIFIVTHLSNGTLFTISVLSELWLLLLLGVIALWVQISQLHMLMRLYREATRDALTGLVNRRILSAKIEEELAAQHENGQNLCVMLFDLDLFKRINDTHGHHTGDVVLQAFSGILREFCRGNVVAGRYGGEEFLAIVPQSSVSEAKQLAEDIREACHHVAVYNNDNEEVLFTTSVGVAQRKPGESAQNLLARVDEGLYAAKAAGRDFVAVAE